MLYVVGLLPMAFGENSETDMYSLYKSLVVISEQEFTVAVKEIVAKRDVTGKWAAGSSTGMCRVCLRSLEKRTRLDVISYFIQRN